MRWRRRRSCSTLSFLTAFFASDLMFEPCRIRLITEIEPDWLLEYGNVATGKKASS